MNKKFIAILLAIIGLLGGGIATDVIDIGGGFSDRLALDQVIQFSTSTDPSGVDPVKLLDINPNRQYALIVNDSDTVIYLFTTTTGPTIVTLDGIRLNASGGSYEISKDNIITDQIWASSTGASKQINITHR